MRITLCVAIFLVLSSPVMAQNEPLNHFVGYGYINTALPIHGAGENVVSFTFVLYNEKRRVAVPCIARGQVAEFVKGLKLKHNEILYFVIGGRLINRHSSLCVAVTSITLATFSARERNQ